MIKSSYLGGVIQGEPRARIHQLAHEGGSEPRVEGPDTLALHQLHGGPEGTDLGHLPIGASGLVVVVMGLVVNFEQVQGMEDGPSNGRGQASKVPAGLASWFHDLTLK